MEEYIKSLFVSLGCFMFLFPLKKKLELSGYEFASFFIGFIILFSIVITKL